MNRFRFEWRLCRRPLTIPLSTSAGEWKERLTLIVRLEDVEGRRGYGEVAPLESFGTESLDYAAQCLRSLGSWQDESSILRIVPNFRATRFGLTSALQDLRGWSPVAVQLSRAGLLALDEASGERVGELLGRGFCSAKVKIGIGHDEVEQRRLQRLLESIPDNFRLRLDANGALDISALQRWVDAFAGDQRIECLEQPLARTEARLQCKLLTRLNERLPLALDESLSSSEDWQFWLEEQNWPGLMVVKPSAYGNLDSVRIPLLQHSERTVLSSAFESVFGLRILLQLAAEARLTRPVGLGTVEYFSDQIGLLESPTFSSDCLEGLPLDELWDELERVS